MQEMEGQMSIFDQDTWCGKMSPEHSPQTKEKTSELCLKKPPKSSTKMPLYLCLKKTNGTQADASWEMGGALLGEYSMHSFGESPKDEEESHLLQILEENPHPKYFLSGKACLGILNRARRRGKQLPSILEEALIHMVVGGTEYGQKGIADTIEILRKMWCEIGTEALKEWVQRTYVLVQSEEILLGEMCKPDEDSEDSNEQVLVEGDSEEDNREEGMCDLRSNREIGDSPQRQKPNEQLSEQLDLLMQKLSHENAQAAVIMYCLRIVCEGEESLPKTLSTISQGENFGADDSNGIAYTMQERAGCEGGGKGALIQTDKSASLRCGNWQTLFQPIERDVIAFDRSAYNQGENAKFDIGINENGIAHSLVAKGPGGVCYVVDQGGGKSSCNVQEGVTPTLTCTHGGEPAVCYLTSHGCFHMNPSKNIANTLVSTDYKDAPTICYGIDPSASRDVGALFIEEKSKTLTNGSCPGHHNGVVVKSVDCRNCTEADINGALQSNSAHSLNGNNVVRVRYIVRRLTPLECERLQGFPDGWTDIGEYINSKGKKCKTSDAARYKALGNSIALPSWRWVVKRISACYERTPTMASLFDGIGGFPLTWEQINGKGTCIWSSEIDDFPDAVTKVRIG